MSALETRFSALLARAGAAEDAGSSLGRALVAAWAEPHRCYHDLGHLGDCLAQLDALPLDRPTHDTIELALWFHDAVYDPRAPDNEERSARWAAEALTAAGIPALANEAARLVHLTAAHAPASDDAGRIMCDIDLSVLGRPVEAFDAYQRRIRAEYAWVPDAVYRRERIRILETFLRRDPLFQTETFRRRFESAAKSNLRNALAVLASGA